jgi:hypothetical protein
MPVEINEYTGPIWVVMLLAAGLATMIGLQVVNALSNRR